jgi:hypothetical protein
MPDRPEYFRCPLCRSVSCERVVVRRAKAAPYMTPFYSCTTCTVMFRDPIAFTRGYEDRPRQPAKVGRTESYPVWSRINQARKDRDK